MNTLNESNKAPTLARLIVERNSASPLVLEMAVGESVRVGRSSNNDLSIEDSNVSRHHAVFTASRSGVVLSDLSSLNGTFVGDQRISTPVNLSSGNIVEIGTAKIKVSIGDGPTGSQSMGSSIGAHSMVTEVTRMEEVVVTILLADVMAYSKLTAQYDTAVVANTLRKWFDEVIGLVESHGGIFDKYIGDCVMALWRSKVDSAEESAFQAVECGKKILVATEALSTEEHWPHYKEQPWGARVALNSGPALMGSVGSGGSADHTVLGDSVNVAFRIEALAGDLDTKILMGQGTEQLVNNKFSLKSLGSHSLKGRTEKIEVYTLRG